MGVQFDVYFSNCTQAPTWHNCSTNWHTASSTLLSTRSYKELTETAHVWKSKNFQVWLHNKTKGPVFQDKMHRQVHTQSNCHLPSPHKQTKNCFNGSEKQKIHTQWHNIEQQPTGKVEPTSPHHAYGRISLCTPPLNVTLVIIQTTYVINVWNDFIHHLKDCFQICRYGQYAVKYKHMCEHQSL